MAVGFPPEDLAEPAIARADSVDTPGKANQLELPGTNSRQIYLVSNAIQLPTDTVICWTDLQ